jgi:hypothetical protein
MPTHPDLETYHDSDVHTTSDSDGCAGCLGGDLVHIGRNKDWFKVVSNANGHNRREPQHSGRCGKSNTTPCRHDPTRNHMQSDNGENKGGVDDNGTELLRVGQGNLRRMH